MGYKVKRIMVGTQQVRPTGWTPGNNTIAYYPLKSDVKDYSGNNKNGTLSGSGTYDGAGLQLTNGNYVSIPNPGIVSYPITLNVYLKINAYSTGGPYSRAYFKTVGEYYEGSPAKGCFCIGYSFSSQTSVRLSGTVSTGTSGQTDINSDNNSLGVWYNLIFTCDGTTSYFYKNGTLIGTKSNKPNSVLNSYNWYINNANNMWGGSITVSNYIIEKKARTAQEIQDYYNLTKSNYGL